MARKVTNCLTEEHSQRTCVCLCVTCVIALIWRRAMCLPGRQQDRMCTLVTCRIVSSTQLRRFPTRKSRIELSKAVHV